MTVSYLVRYEIVPDNATSFLAHYRDAHAAILQRLPGLRRLVLHHAIDSADPMGVSAGSAFLLVQMDFDDERALAAALASPARAEAREDFRRFPGYVGAVTHQAMRAEVLFDAGAPRADTAPAKQETAT